MDIFNRIKNILMAPNSEFPTLKTETVDVAGLYKRYLVYVAALPAIGTIIFAGEGFGDRLTMAIVGYVVALASFFISAFIIDALAPSFASTKNLANSLKLVGCASTSLMAGQFFRFLPGIGLQVSLAGFIYGIYLFYLGLPVFMDTQREKAIFYIAVASIVNFAVYMLLRAILFRAVGLDIVWG